MGKVENREGLGSFRLTETSLILGPKWGKQLEKGLRKASKGAGRTLLASLVASPILVGCAKGSGIIADRETSLPTPTPYLPAIAEISQERIDEAGTIVSFGVPQGLDISTREGQLEFISLFEGILVLDGSTTVPFVDDQGRPTGEEITVLLTRDQGDQPIQVWIYNDERGERVATLVTWLASKEEVQNNPDAVKIDPFLVGLGTREDGSFGLVLKEDIGDGQAQVSIGSEGLPSITGVKEANLNLPNGGPLVIIGGTTLDLRVKEETILAATFTHGLTLEALKATPTPEATPTSTPTPEPTPSFLTGEVSQEILENNGLLSGIEMKTPDGEVLQITSALSNWEFTGFSDPESLYGFLIALNPNLKGQNVRFELRPISNLREDMKSDPALNIKVATSAPSGKIEAYHMAPMSRDGTTILRAYVDVYAYSEAIIEAIKVWEEYKPPYSLDSIISEKVNMIIFEIAAISGPYYIPGKTHSGQIINDKINELGNGDIDKSMYFLDPLDGKFLDWNF